MKVKIFYDDIKSFKQKVEANIKMFEDQRKKLISEIIEVTNDELLDIRDKLIKLGFEENSDHFTHIVETNTLKINPPEFSTNYINFACWDIYLGKEREPLISISLRGEKNSSPLFELPEYFVLKIERWKYEFSSGGISRDDLNGLFNIWLDEINSRISPLEELKELKIELSLLS